MASIEEVRRREADYQQQLSDLAAKPTEPTAAARPQDDNTPTGALALARATAVLVDAYSAMG